MPLVEGCKHEVEITVPPEDVAKETEHVVEEVRKKAHLPGFRPGKAPLSLIRSRFKAEVRKDVLEHILPKAFRQRAAEENWQVVGTPNISEIHFEENEPLRFKAEFEVAPEFELGEYRGLEVPYAEPQVEESDVEKRLNELRERKAEFVNEDPRPLQDGDYALVSLETVAGIEGEPIKNDSMLLHIGEAETLPEFSENLRGMSPDEEKEFEVTYPAEYGQERLAGKTVRFKVQPKQVRRKELPELNDEFARDLGDYKTFDELKDAIRASIRAEREHAAQQESKNKLVDSLVEGHEFAVPNAYVDRQIEFQLERQLREIAAQGVDPRELKLDWNKIRESQKERASKDVRASLLLERIADAESIHASGEEVDREVQRIAKSEREPVAAIRQRLEKEGGLTQIAGRIRTEKTLAYLFDNARKVAPPPVESAPEASEASEAVEASE
jgi:trigger factor